MTLIVTPMVQARIFTTFDVPPSLGNNTQANGINDAGQIVGIYLDSAQYRSHGFLLSNGNYSSIDSPPQPYPFYPFTWYCSNTILIGINNAGQIVGNCMTDGWIRSFLYSNGNYSTINYNFPAPDTVPQTFINTTLNGINNGGQIVGYEYPTWYCFQASLTGYFYNGYHSTSPCYPLSTAPIMYTHGLLFSWGSLSPFDITGAYTLSNPGIFPNGINNNGQIAGTYIDNQGSWQHGFVLTNGVLSTFNLPNLVTSGYTNYNQVQGINNAGQIVGFYMSSDGVEHGFLRSANGSFSDIDVRGATSTWANGINDAGQIVGYYSDSNYNMHGFLMSPDTLLDPVPDLLNDLATPDYSALAIKGRVVEGIAADGVAEILIRMPAQTAGDTFTLTVMNDQGNPSISTDEDGGLFPVGGTCCSTASVTVTSQKTTNTPDPAYAFALYRAPKDFVRPNNSTDSGLDHRTVNIQITLNNQAPSTVPVKIVRPPVALIHGIWGDPTAWDFFAPLYNPDPTKSDPRFFVRTVTYEKTKYLGFQENAVKVIGDLWNKIDEFKSAKKIAAIQADIVAHSMGGDIARYFVKFDSYLRPDNFNQGDVHKLITLDTPHNGSPLAANLYQSNSICQSLWNLSQQVISDGVRDLIPGSPALQAIGTLSSSPVHLQAHLIAGYANSSQELTVENNYQSGLLIHYACPNLLSNASGNFVGFKGIMGHSDLVVPLLSEEADSPALGLNATQVPYDEMLGYIHSVNRVLFFNADPDILNRGLSYTDMSYIASNSAIPNTVINLLNRSVLDPTAFGAILP